MLRTRDPAPAGELTERLDVSARTVCRDVEALSAGTWSPTTGAPRGSGRCCGAASSSARPDCPSAPGSAPTGSTSSRGCTADC
nr:helix-turn-helix domain-containing protein [Streptomyces solincola]